MTWSLVRVEKQDCEREHEGHAHLENQFCHSCSYWHYTSHKIMSGMLKQATWFKATEKQFLA